MPQHLYLKFKFYVVAWLADLSPCELNENKNPNQEDVNHSFDLIRTEAHSFCTLITRLMQIN
jgi:hypothetical protein